MLSKSSFFNAEGTNKKRYRIKEEIEELLKENEQNHSLLIQKFQDIYPIFYRAIAGDEEFNNCFKKEHETVFLIAEMLAKEHISSFTKCPLDEIAMLWKWKTNQRGDTLGILSNAQLNGAPTWGYTLEGQHHIYLDINHKHVADVYMLFQLINHGKKLELIEEMVKESINKDDLVNFVNTMPERFYLECFPYKTSILHEAVKAGHAEFIYWLLGDSNIFVRLHAKNDEGLTPVELALEQEFLPHRANIAKIILLAHFYQCRRDPNQYQGRFFNPMERALLHSLIEYVAGRISQIPVENKEALQFSGINKLYNLAELYSQKAYNRPLFNENSLHSKTFI